MEFHGIPPGCHRIPLKFHGNNITSMVFYGIPWHSTWMPYNSTEMPWKSIETMETMAISETGWPLFRGHLSSGDRHFSSGDASLHEMPLFRRRLFSGDASLQETPLFRGHLFSGDTSFQGTLLFRRHFSSGDTSLQGTPLFRGLSSGDKSHQGTPSLWGGGAFFPLTKRHHSTRDSSLGSLVSEGTPLFRGHWWGTPRNLPRDTEKSPTYMA